MRHGMSGRKFNRSKSHRAAMLANLANSLIENEQIKTTLPKAKDLRPLVEKWVTVGKKGTLAARRHALEYLNPHVAKKLLGPLAERYKDRQGGYVRIVKAGFRYGDNAPMAIIEFVDRDLSAKGAANKVAAPVEEAPSA